MDWISKFETRLLGAFGIALLVVVALAASAWDAAREVYQTARWVTHTHEVLDHLEGVKTDSLLIELNTQNYLLTGDTGNLAARDAAVAAREVSLRRVQELTADNPSQQEHGVQLRATADKHLAIATHIEQLRKTEGSVAANAYAADAPLRETHLFGILLAMNAEERRLLQVREEKLTKAREFRTVLSAISSFLLAALLVATYLMIRRQFSVRVQAEAALRDSEESLVITLHSIGDAVMATDTEGRITRMNPVAEQLTGWHLADAQGRLVDEVFRIINEHTRASAEVPVAKVLATGEMQGLANHTALIARDGSECPIADSAAPIRDAMGQVGGVVLVFRDVTAERLAERAMLEQNELLEQRVREQTEQLRASEEQLRNVINNSPALIAYVDAGQRYVFTNQPYRKLFALPGQESIAGCTVREVLGEARYAIAAPMIARALQGESQYYDWSPYPDVWQTVNYVPHHDGQNRVVGYYVLITDITKRKLAEHALQKSEERFHLLVANVKDYAIIMFDPEGRVATWNEGAERLKGYTEAEILGQPMGRFYLPEDVAAGKPARLLALAQAERLCEDRGWQVRKDGSRFFVDAVIIALHNRADKLVGFAKITHDITERKRAEEQQEAEKSVLESISLGRSLAEILEMIARNVETILPDALCSVQLLDKDGSHLRNVAGPSLPEEYNRLVDGLPVGPQAGSCGTAAYRNEQVIVTDIAADPLWADYAAVTLPFGLRACWSTPVRSGAGKLLATFALYYREPRAPGQADFDLIERWARLTGIAVERKRAEQEIVDLNASLEQRVVERTAQLEEASRTKSDFLANMSHELRTPLNSIIGFSEMLKDGVLGDLEAKQRSFITDIFDAGTHLLSLINDILDLSKVEAGMLELEMGAVDVQALLQSSLTVVREKALTQRIRLDTRLGPVLGDILADQRKLKQIVYNLLSNAVKFTPEGGSVTLAARRCTRAEVAFGATMPARLIPLPPGDANEFLAIEVEDSGIGILEADMGKLFEPFMQVDNSATRHHTGTGLGLSLVRSLAELHGGTVGVASRLGVGTRFCVWLPWREAAPVVQQPQALPAAMPVSAVPLALVVEDDDHIADLIVAQLRTEGFQPVRTSTAEEGLVLAAKHRPDLITLDIFLPAMDGWEFMRRLRDDTDIADTPVVIITISGNLQHGLVLGARRVLQKPFAAEELAAALAGLVGMRPDDAAPCVLVVDDNVKAVELVATVLEAEGCRVLRAYGGAEGIMAAGRTRPDLIILDLMMPEVSGFDVVRALRESALTERIPILVLTAKDLTAGERLRLNGAVSAILAKTDFNRDVLLAELRRALPRPGGN